MAKDPSYVRLVDRLARGTQVDIESGWSIAGLDVREFPSDDYPRQQTYVRDCIRRGTLEGCSKAEFEEVMNHDNDFLAASGVTVKGPEIEGFVQEAHVVGAADERRRQLETSRGFGEGGLSYKDDHARRVAILRAQNAAEEGEVPDPEDGADGRPSEEDEKKAESELKKTSGKAKASS